MVGKLRSSSSESRARSAASLAIGGVLDAPATIASSSRGEVDQVDADEVILLLPSAARDTSS